MKSKKILLISSIVILLSLVLSACTGAAGASTSWHAVTADSTQAYLAAGTQVYAVDLSTGSQKWKFPSDKPNTIGFYAQPVLTSDGQVLLVPGYDGYLYYVNPTTGAPIKNVLLSKYRLIASPLIVDNIIYQPSTDGTVYALNMQGVEVQRFQTTSGEALWAQPATASGCGCIYITSMDHSVYAFNLKSGQLIWQSQDLGGSIAGKPAVGPDGTLYLGTFNKEMIALDGATGSVLNRFTTQDKVWAGPALDNGVLYFGDLSGNFYAVNTADFTEVWRPFQPKADDEIVDTPLISGDNLYLSTKTPTVYTISKAGEVVNTTTVGGQFLYSTPVIAGDILLVTPLNYEKNLLVALPLENPNAAAKWLFVPAK
jgi:outer membrane protein assembly factor BamB